MAWLNRLRAARQARRIRKAIYKGQVEVSQLSNLETLDLSNNRLNELPAELGQLTNLETLDLAYNRLTALPAELGQLTNLKMLNLRSNDLTALPAELGRLTNLETLDPRANPLEAPLLEFVEKGVPAVLEYLRSLADAAPRYEGKLVSVDAPREGTSQDKPGTDSQRITRPWTESWLPRKYDFGMSPTWLVEDNVGQRSLGGLGSGLPCGVGSRAP
jgi:hypothetical protein